MAETPDVVKRDGLTSQQRDWLHRAEGDCGSDSISDMKRSR